MAIDYVIDWERRRVRTIVEGKVRPEDYRDLFDAYAAAGLDETFDHLADYRRIELSATIEEMRIIADLYGAHAHLFRARNAVVVADRATYGMARMFDALAERFGLRIEIFTCMEDAEAFLEGEPGAPPWATC